MITETAQDIRTAIRPFRPEDLPAVQRIIAANGDRLSHFGTSHYGEYGAEYLAKGINMVAERDGKLLGFCQFRPDPTGHRRAIVACFVVDTALHMSGSYVRIHLAMERHIASQGFTWIVAWVPQGHDKFRLYLEQRRHYRPYHTSEDGTTFYLKEI